MPKAQRQKLALNSARASRDGHTYHDMWAARVSLQLLHPSTTLTALAIEGFASGQPSSRTADEIADVVLYHGAQTVQSATRVEVVQLKYSNSRARLPATLSYLAPTLRKFAAVHRESKFRSKYSYEFVCNRPISGALLSDLAELRDRGTRRGPIGRLYGKLSKLTGLSGAELADFAGRLAITPCTGSIATLGHEIRHTLASWSEAATPDIRLRYLGLLELLNSKAGGKGARDNVVRRTDVLAALEIEDERDLFPCPSAFPAVQSPLEREVLSSIESAIAKAATPVLVHAPGGGGKTVIMQLLADRLAKRNVVLLFDGYAGGGWRDPSDARHLPRRAITQLANTLACDHGLCDILLPSPGEDDRYVRALRARLEKSVETLRSRDVNARVILLLDAIDHAGLAADAGINERSYARLLIQSLAANPVQGVVLVASCRSERRPLATAGTRCTEIPIPNLSLAETQSIAAQAGLIENGTVALLHTRSGGNPRVLAALIAEARQPTSGRRQEAVIELDSLISAHLEHAIAEAARRGSEGEGRVLLTALALLPPPVPVAELAGILLQSPDLVRSLAADLHPLVESTSQGLIFRDEPTETYMRIHYRADLSLVQKVTDALSEAQGRSPYAAATLPHLLAELGRHDELLTLAFDERVPQLGGARVGEREVRLSRVIAAMRAGVARGRTTDLFALLLEAARLSNGTERSDQFLLNYPELAAMSRDAAILRRLEEMRGYAPIQRHTALAISYALAGDQGEATRHSQRNWDWLFAGDQQDNPPDHVERSQPGNKNWAATLFVAVRNGHAKGVVRWLASVSSRDAVDAYAITGALVDLLVVAGTVHKTPLSLEQFAEAVLEGGPHLLPLAVAVLTRATQLLPALQRRMLKRACALAKRPASLRTPRTWRDTDLSDYQTALLIASLRAAAMGASAASRQFLVMAGIKRVDSYRHRGEPDYADVTKIVIAASIEVAIKNRHATLRDLAPADLHTVAVSLYGGDNPLKYEEAVTLVLKEPNPSASQPVLKPALSYEERQRLRDVIDHRVRKLLPLVDTLAALIRSPRPTPVDMTTAIRIVESTVSDGGSYRFRDDASYFGRIGVEAIVCVTASLDLLDSTAGAMLSALVAQYPFFLIPFKTRLVSALAVKPQTASLASAAAMAIEADISTIESVDSRVSAYADLALAVAASSIGEAQSYLAKAIAAVDGLGASDLDTVYPLVRLVALTPQHLAPDAAHAFNRVAELNLADVPDKFIWTTMGRALSRACGADALAQLARWDNRGIARLSYGLPPLLTALISDGKLSPALAVALIGIGEPLGSWDWDLGDFASAVLPRLPPDQRERAAGVILQELDRTSGGKVWFETVVKLQQACTPHLYTDSSALARLRCLNSALHRGQVTSSQPTGIPPRRVDYVAIDRLTARLDPLDGKAIDKAIARIRSSSRLQHLPLSAVLLSLSERVQLIDERIQFLDTVAKLVQPLEQKLLVMENLNAKWSSTSHAIRDQFAVIGRKLIAMHGAELIDAGWMLDAELRRLHRLGVPRTTVLSDLIRALGRDCMTVPSHAWLALAEGAAADSQAAIARSLERYLLTSSANIPEDIAGGPWRPELVPPAAQADLIAKLLWVRLGAPEAADRWRAAHAVLRLSEFGLCDHIDALVIAAGQPVGRAVASTSAPFLSLHAQLWLINALAQLAHRDPVAAMRYRSHFEAQLENHTSQHALLRHLAVGALTDLLPLAPRTVKRSIERLIAEAQETAKGYRHVVSLKRPGFYHGGPPGHKPVFYFDYDFHKNEIDSLARVFGLPTWRVERQCALKVKSMDPTATHWSDTGGQSGRSSWEEDMRSSDATPRKDIWGTYLSWHALLATGMELFARHPVVCERDDKSCPWQDWLARFTPSLPDGSWRAAITQMFPCELIGTHWSTSGATNQKGGPLPDRAADLAKIIGLGGPKLIADWLTVKAYWRAPAGFTVAVSSAMIKEPIARHGAWAVMSAEPHDRWLPSESDDYFHPFGKPEHPFISWLSHAPHVTTGLDRHDPYAISTAFPFDRPAAKLERELGLRSTRLGELWLLGTTEILRARGWGGTTFTAREERSTAGSDLQCQTAWLTRYLGEHNLALAILVAANWYQSSGSRDSDHDVRQVLLIIRQDGSIELVDDTPKRIQAIVGNIRRDERHDIRIRYREIIQATSKSARR